MRFGKISSNEKNVDIFFKAIWENFNEIFMVKKNVDGKFSKHSQFSQFFVVAM